jgi:hypothetical protein
LEETKLDILHLRAKTYYDNTTVDCKSENHKKSKKIYETRGKHVHRDLCIKIIDKKSKLYFLKSFIRVNCNLSIVPTRYA